MHKNLFLQNTILICAGKMLFLLKVLNVSLAKRYRLQIYACTSGSTQRTIRKLRVYHRW